MPTISGVPLSKNETKRTFLFLQGPMSPFFSRLGIHLRAEGHAVHRINLCPGDQIFWRAGGAHNFRGRFGAWPTFIERFLNSNEVTDLIMLGDCRPHHRVAIEAAKNADVDITVIELGYLRPNWLTIERGGMSSLSHFPNRSEKIHKIATQVDHVEEPIPDPSNYFARMATWDVIYKLSNVFFFWLFPFYRFHSVHHPVHEYLLWIRRLWTQKKRNKQANKIVEDLVASHQTKPFFLYALQLNTDFQIRAHSSFDNQQQSVEHIFQSFRQNADGSARLVIKQHPLDPGVVNWEKFIQRKAREMGLEDRVIFIDGGDLVQLLKTCLGLVVINSTVGTMAITQGTPFITLGAAIFDVDDLSFQGSLDDFWTDREPPDPALASAFTKAIKATIQVSGGFYSKIAISQAVARVATKLLNGSINGYGAYEAMPPRYKKKAKVEVPWYQD